MGLGRTCASTVLHAALQMAHAPLHTLHYAPNINVQSEAPGESADSGGHRLARALLDDALERRDEQRAVRPLGLDRHEARRVREHLVRVRVR